MSKYVVLLMQVVQLKESKYHQCNRFKRQYFATFWPIKFNMKLYNNVLLHYYMLCNGVAFDYTV